MTGMKRHSEGFTLSELLLSVAIVLVLVLIAVPSVISAQGNLRMAELNDSARQIANVAQSQMTSLKGAGTWYAEITDDEGQVVFGEAKNLPADVDPADVYYLTADEARDRGIVPALSIDEEVRSRDYVIEFDASTATVVSVFFSDGKDGFFAPSPDSTTAAQAYYDAEGSRDQAARMRARPMIGYYQGTPEGATPEAALRAPVIYVDGQGQLCVQNRNLDDHGRSSGDDWHTTVSATLTKTDGSAAFVVGGLDETAQTFTVSLPDGSEQRSYSNAGDTKAVELTGRTEASVIDDVFSVDLNAIARIVNADGGAGDLATAVNGFSQGDDLRVDAEVDMVGPSVPAKAAAFMKWPGNAASLAVYVTDPAPNADEVPSSIRGTYTKPKVELLSTAGTPPVTDIQMQDDEKVFDVAGTPRSLINENGESAHQSYAGGRVSLSEAASQQARVQATVGSYRPSPSWPYWYSASPHRYQINEIWVNDVRVGYLKQNAWVWEDTAAASAFRGCLVDLPGGAVDVDTTSLTIDARTLVSSGIPTNDNGDYEVYLRTAPRTDEVQTFFANQVGTIRNMLSSGASADSRDTGNASRAIRGMFENEFGAPSTVASWHMTRQSGDTPQTATSAGAFPSRNDLRIYYSWTPAVAWGDGTYGGQSPYTALPDAFLMLFEYVGWWTGQQQQPTAFVRDARTGTQDNYALALKANGGFEIPDDRDQLFFRIVEYCDENGSPLRNYDLQYVPYTVQDDGTYATVANGPSRGGDYVFAGWTYAANPAVSVAAGSVVGSYDSSLDFGYVQLNARYRLANTVGLMYLEFDSAGNVTGYYGSLDGSTMEGNLPDDNEIASWGYYVVAPANARAPWYQAGGDKTSQYNWSACSLARRSVFIEGNLYDVYYAPTTWTPEDTYDDIPFKAGSSPVNAWNIDINATPTYEYAYGFDLAAAVAAGSSAGDVATSWGSESNPWTVRYWNQFLGCMDINNKQPHYLADSFIQTHDIDLEGEDVQWQNGYVFQGHYDGAGFDIKGYKLLNDGNNYAGLFTNTSNAELENIHMTDVKQVRSASDWTVNMSTGPGVKLGLLVGQAQDTTIKECTVSGETSSSGSSLSIYVRWPGSGSNYIGGLVGYNVGDRGDNASSSITNCQVEDISFVLVNPIPQYSGMEMNIGGLVGLSEDTVIDERGLSSDQHAVSNVRLELSAHPLTGVSINMGGLVGRLDPGWSWWGTSFIPQLPASAVTDVDLTSNIPGTPSAFYAGALIGETERWISPGYLTPDMFDDVRHNGTLMTDAIGKNG